MGNPDSKIKNNSKTILIQLPKIDYFKGENINGEIILNVELIPLSFHQINISLYLNEGWYYETGGEDSTLYSEKNEIVLKSFQLNVRELLNKNPNQELITLNQGNYYLPFNYKLSTLISPSCEYYMNSGRGFLRYYLKAELISPYNNSGEKNEIYEQLLIVKSPPKILKSPLVFTKESNVKKWGLLNKGNTILHVTYYKNYGVFDEMVPITVTVDNSKGDLDVTLIKVTLIRNINFLKFKNNSSFYFKSHAIELKSNVCIKKNCKETFNYQINLRDNNLKKKNFYKIDDPYSDNIDLNYLLPTVNGNLIRCDYVIKISCEFESLVTYNNRPRVFLPLNIGHPGKDDINDSILNHKGESFVDMEELKPEKDKMYNDFVVVEDSLNDNKNECKSEIVEHKINPNDSEVNENSIPFKSMPHFGEYGIGNNNYEKNTFNQNNDINYNYNQYQSINSKNNYTSYDNQNSKINYNYNDNQNNYHENDINYNLNDNLNNNTNNNQINNYQNNLYENSINNLNNNTNNNQINNYQNNLYENSINNQNYNTNNNQINNYQNNSHENSINNQNYNTNNNQINNYQNNLYENSINNLNNDTNNNQINNYQNNLYENSINNQNYNTNNNQINNYQNNLYENSIKKKNDNTNNSLNINSNFIPYNSSNNNIHNGNYINEESQNYNQNNYSNYNLNINSKQNFDEESHSNMKNKKEKKIDELKSNNSNNIIEEFLNSTHLNNESINFNSNNYIEEFLNGPYKINNNDENDNNEN